MKNYILLIISFITFLLEINCSSPGKADNGLGEERASQKSIISFAFLKSKNPRLEKDYFAAVNQNTGDIALTIKQDSLVDTAELIATYTFAGSYVVIDSVVQQSGVTSNDFRKNKRYRVFSENGKYKDYNVTINFILSFPFKPEAYDVAIIGDLAVGKTIGAAYTFIDRNGEIEQDSVINWYFESDPSSGDYVLYKTQTVTPSSTSNKLSDATIKIPSGKESCKVRLSVIPKSKSEINDSSVGYETKTTSKSCIKAGFSESLIIINEVCTFSEDNPRDEYIVLYNSSINDTDLSDCKLEYYDSENAEWKLYCDFGDPSMFFKPEFFDYPALKLFTVKTAISAKGYYLVSRQETEGSVKRISDIVLKTDNTKDLLQDSGSIRLVKNSDVIDKFSYGKTEEYEGSKIEGTSLETHADGEILKRINNIDTNVSANDIKPRPQLSPLSSGQNIVDTSYGPLIIGRIKEEASKPSAVEDVDGIYENVSTTYWLGGTADDDPKYTFHDWLYGGESTHEYNWIIYYLNSSGQEVILNDNYPPGTPEDKKFVANSKGVQFEINKHDYELIPPGRQAKIRLKITPIAFNPTNSKDIRGNELIFEYDDPVTLNVPAKAKITKFKPLTNQVEIFLERGGTLHNLYIGHAYPTPDVDNPENEIVECANSQIISNLTQTYSTGDYLTIFTDGKGLGDVINLPSIDIFDCSLFALRGGILEIKELKGWKLGTNRDDPDFGYQDVILYGLGNHLSQKSLALKKYLVEINSIFRENYDRTNGLPKFKYASGIWKLQPGVAPFEAFPANLSGDPVSEALEDMTDEDYTNALTNTDYIKIPANINSYIIYRDNGDDVVEKITNPEDLSVDYYITTPYYEYVYNGSYCTIQLNNYKTMIETDIQSSNIPLFTTTSNYLLCYAVYLTNSGNVTSNMSEIMTLGLSDPFINSTPDLELIFDYDVLPISFLTIGYTYIGLNWKNQYNKYYSTYTQFGPISTPNFAYYYPVPKFTDSVIHRKKESAPSATYVDTNSTSDFDISSAW